MPVLWDQEALRAQLACQEIILEVACQQETLQKEGDPALPQGNSF